MDEDYGFDFSIEDNTAIDNLDFDTYDPVDCDSLAWNDACSIGEFDPF